MYESGHNRLYFSKFVEGKAILGEEKPLWLRDAPVEDGGCLMKTDVLVKNGFGLAGVLWPAAGIVDADLRINALPPSADDRRTFNPPPFVFLRSDLQFRISYRLVILLLVSMHVQVGSLHNAMPATFCLTSRLGKSSTHGFEDS